MRELYAYFVLGAFQTETLLLLRRAQVFSKGVYIRHCFAGLLAEIDHKFRREMTHIGQNLA